MQEIFLNLTFLKKLKVGPKDVLFRQVSLYFI